MKISLAKHSAEGNIFVKDIAENEKMPYHYIGKILQRLRKFGYVESCKGRGGGFRIIEKTKECSILEIINTVQGDMELDTKIFELDSCCDGNECRFCKKWRSLNDQITLLLMTQKIKDIAN